MSSGCFITGTDTGVGKTRVALALLAALNGRGLRATGMKPVAAGCRMTPAGLRNEDALALAAASAVAVPYEQLNPYALPAPIAPHIAAREAGIDIDLELIARRHAALAARVDFTVVEGAGGWRVPLGAAADMAGLARRLGLPVVLVVGLRLGCLNHALLTAESIERTGLPLAGWVANAIDPQFERLAENLAALDERLAAPRLGLLPHGVAPAAAARMLDLEPLVG